MNLESITAIFLLLSKLSSQQFTRKQLDINKELEIFQACSTQILYNNMNSKELQSDNYNLAPLTIPTFQTAFEYEEVVKRGKSSDHLYCDHDAYKLIKGTGYIIQKMQPPRTKCLCLVYIDPQPCSTWSLGRPRFQRLESMFPNDYKDGRYRDDRFPNPVKGQYFIRVKKWRPPGEAEISNEKSFLHDISFLLGFYLKDGGTTFPTSIIFELEESTWRNGGNAEGYHIRAAVYDRDLFGGVELQTCAPDTSRYDLPTLCPVNDLQSSLVEPRRHYYDSGRIETFLDLDMLSYSQTGQSRWMAVRNFSYHRRKLADREAYLRDFFGEKRDLNLAEIMLMTLVPNLSMALINIRGIPSFRERESWKGFPTFLGKDEMNSLKFLTCASLHLKKDVDWSAFLAAFDFEIWMWIGGLGLGSGIMLQIIDLLRRWRIRKVRMSRCMYDRMSGEMIWKKGHLPPGRNIIAKENVTREMCSGKIHPFETSATYVKGKGVASTGSGNMSEEMNLDDSNSKDDGSGSRKSISGSSKKSRGFGSDRLNSSSSTRTIDPAPEDDQLDDINSEKNIMDTITGTTQDEKLDEENKDVSATGGIDVVYPERNRYLKTHHNELPVVPHQPAGISLGASIGNLTFVYTFLVAQRTKIVHKSKWLCGGWAVVSIIFAYSYKQIIGVEMRQSLYFTRDVYSFRQLASANFTIYSPQLEPHSGEFRTIFDYFLDKGGRGYEYWYLRNQFDLLRQQIFRPEGADEMSLFLKDSAEFFFERIGKCKSEAFVNVYEILLEFQLKLYKKNGKLANIGYESLSVGKPSDWRFDNVPWPASLHSLKLMRLEESGLLKIWKAWKIWLYTWQIELISEDLRKQVTAEKISLGSNILVLFYLYLWMILGCGVAWLMEHVWKLFSWLIGNCVGALWKK